MPNPMPLSGNCDVVRIWDGHANNVAPQQNNIVSNVQSQNNVVNQNQTYMNMNANEGIPEVGSSTILNQPVSQEPPVQQSSSVIEPLISNQATTSSIRNDNSSMATSFNIENNNQEINNGPSVNNSNGPISPIPEININNQSETL